MLLPRRPLENGAAVHYDPVEEVLELLSDGQRSEALARLDVVLREEPWQGTLFALRGLICADAGLLDEAHQAGVIPKPVAASLRVTLSRSLPWAATELQIESAPPALYKAATTMTAGGTVCSSVDTVEVETEDQSPPKAL